MLYSYTHIETVGVKGLTDPRLSLNCELRNALCRKDQYMYCLIFCRLKKCGDHDSRAIQDSGVFRSGLALLANTIGCRLISGNPLKRAVATRAGRLANEIRRAGLISLLWAGHGRLLMLGRWAGRCRATRRTRVATTVIELDAEPDRQPITHWQRTTGSLDRPRLSGTSMTIHTLYDTLLDVLSLGRSLSTTLSRLVERRSFFLHAATAMTKLKRYAALLC